MNQIKIRVPFEATPSEYIISVLLFYIHVVHDFWAGQTKSTINAARLIGYGFYGYTRQQDLSIIQPVYFTSTSYLCSGSDTF